MFVARSFTSSSASICRRAMSSLSEEVADGEMEGSGSGKEANENTDGQAIPRSSFGVDTTHSKSVRLLEVKKEKSRWPFRR